MNIKCSYTRWISWLRLFLIGLGFVSCVPLHAATQVTLAWDPNSETDLAGYYLYIGTNSGVYYQKNDVGNVTTNTVSGLSGSQQYFFVVTAYNTEGLESDPSNEVSINGQVAVTNAAPTLNAIGNLVLNEDAGTQTVALSGISAGTGESQTLAISAASSNPALVPNPTVTYASPQAAGSLTLTPVANASGSAVITVTVNDGQANNNTVSRTFTVTINPVNDAPTLNAIGNLTLNEDASAQTVALSGISAGAGESQSLAISTTSSNPALVPNPTVTYTSPQATGSLTLAPTANASGSAVITVTVNDSQANNNTFSRTFTVTINPVNDAPTLNAIANLTLNENAAAQTVTLSGVSAGSGESQSLTISAISSNPALVPNPTVTYTNPQATGSLTFTPAANASGSAVITVTVNDSQANNNTFSRTFTVTINSVNDAPTLNAIANLTLNEDAAPQRVTLIGISAGSGESQSLTISAISSNPTLVPNPTVTYTSPQATGSLTLTPATNVSGSTVITVIVNDGQATNNTVSRSFTVTINPVNDAPSLTGPTELTVSKGVASAVSNLQAQDIDALTNAVILSVSVPHGTLWLATNVAGGITPTQVTGNGSTNITAIARLSVLNTTLAATQGLTYRSAQNFHGFTAINLTLNDNGNTGSGGALSRSHTVSLQVRGKPMDYWRDSYFTTTALADPTQEATVWGDEADVDGDGRPNLMEYALGLNPMLPDTESSAIAIQLNVVSGKNYQVISFLRRKNAPEIQYIPEVSADRVQWHSDANHVATVGTSDLDAEFEVAFYQDLLPVAPGTPRYFRLRALKTSE